MKTVELKSKNERERELLEWAENNLWHLKKINDERCRSMGIYAPPQSRPLPYPIEIWRARILNFVKWVKNIF